MKISSIQNYQNRKIEPSFSAKGKPISLEYIVDKKSQFLPTRVLNTAKKILKTKDKANISLYDLHKSIYAPLLDCKTLDEAKKIFPEFSLLKEKVDFKRESIYTRTFRERTDENFVLDTLKDYWARLKDFEEIAHKYNMPSRTTLQRPLELVHFPTYVNGYKMLLKASDAEGNKSIAAKTTAWNSLHPDLMRKRNKHAAQFCKKNEFREAQSKRVKEYDAAHPERREKISKSLKQAWDNCPEIKDAMSDSIKKEPPIIARAIIKQRKGLYLTELEKRIANSFYKRFWDSHPELKKMFSDARKNIKE